MDLLAIHGTTDMLTGPWMHLWIYEHVNRSLDISMDHDCANRSLDICMDPLWHMFAYIIDLSTCQYIPRYIHGSHSILIYPHISPWMHSHVKVSFDTFMDQSTWHVNKSSQNSNDISPRHYIVAYLHGCIRMFMEPCIWPWIYQYFHTSFYITMALSTCEHVIGHVRGSLNMSIDPWLHSLVYYHDNATLDISMDLATC